MGFPSMKLVTVHCLLVIWIFVSEAVATPSPPIVDLGYALHQATISQVRLKVSPGQYIADTSRKIRHI